MIAIVQNHDALRPIFRWWIQVSVLALFVHACWKHGVSSRSIATWFVVSIIPHAALGIWQFTSQQVIGTKWLGVASQLPQTLGVSVVAHDGLRILRAYGGFPHPNIFGGWLAVGVLVSSWLSVTSQKRRDMYLWILASSALASVLVLTFARGAWLGFVVGIVAMFVGAGLKPAPTSEKNKRFVFMVPLVVFALIFFSQRTHVFARFDLSQRLEQKSVDQRIGSLRTGIGLFLEHPFMGAGPNAELLSLATGQQKRQAPLEPPHSAFLLALDDFGIIGFLAITMLCAVGIRAYRRTPSDQRAHIHAPVLVCLCMLALFDHYLWSTWSGQTLVAIAILLSVEPKSDP